MSWKGVVTNVGSEMIAQCASGTSMTITRVLTGTGNVPIANMRGRTALAAPKATGEIIRSQEIDDSESGNGVKIFVQIGPYTTPYTLTEVGIYAKLEGQESDSLLMIFEQDGLGIAIPQASIFPDYCYRFATVISINNTSDLSVTISSSAYVSVSTMEEAIDEKLIVLNVDGTSETTKAILDSRIQADHRVTLHYLMHYAPIQWTTEAGKLTLSSAKGIPDMTLFLTR